MGSGLKVPYSQKKYAPEKWFPRIRSIKRISATIGRSGHIIFSNCQLMFVKIVGGAKSLKALGNNRVNESISYHPLA